MKINLYRTLGKTCDLLFSNRLQPLQLRQNMAGNKREDDEAHETKASPRVWSLSGSGLVTSWNFVVFHSILLFFCVCVSEHFIMVLKKIVVFWKRLLCSQKDCFVPANIVVFSKRLLCSHQDWCVPTKIVMFWKNCYVLEKLLCFEKDCCVLEEKLSCVLPLWAAVHLAIPDHIFETLF